MNKIRTAPKDYVCNWCERKIFEGTRYMRRSEHNGIHFKDNEYHIECGQAKASEDAAKKAKKGK